MHHKLDHKNIISLSKLASHGFSCGKQPFVDEHVWCRVRIPPISTHIIIILQLVYQHVALVHIYILSYYIVSYEYYDIHCD